MLIVGEMVWPRLFVPISGNDYFGRLDHRDGGRTLFEFESLGRTGADQGNDLMTAANVNDHFSHDRAEFDG